MAMIEDSIPSGSDPLEAPPAEDQGDGDNNNIERIEHAPDHGKDSSSPDENSEGRLYIWLSMLVCVLGIAVIIAVIVVVGGDEDGDDGGSADLPDFEPLVTFPPAPVVEDPQTQLDMIRSAVEAEEVTKDLVDILPTSVSGLSSVFVSDTTVDPALRAASWVILQDEYNAEDQIVERFALAALYFATGGSEWTIQENWLTSTSFCDGWYGLVCCGEFFQGSHLRCDGKHPEHIAELRLRENNMAGEIPRTLALLKDVNTINFSWNKLTGPLEGTIFAALPELINLSVQNNQLTGPIDERLDGNGVLESLYVYGNYFEGPWPERFCFDIPYYGLDCRRNECVDSCCDNSNMFQTCHDLSHTYEGN